MFGKHEIGQAVLGSECILKLIGANYEYERQATKTSKS